MKPIKTVAAGLLLAFGFFCLMVAVSGLVETDPDKQADGREIALGGVGVAIPALGMGGWLAWGLYREGKNKKLALDKEERDRLQGIFFQMIRERNGQITALHFAMETQLSAHQAKQYLEEQAQEFNADFEVNDRGDVIYRFKV
jgi:predicted transcriptional regulator